jgi:hypothetical protein
MLQFRSLTHVAHRLKPFNALQARDIDGNGQTTSAESRSALFATRHFFADSISARAPLQHLLRVRGRIATTPAFIA